MKPDDKDKLNKCLAILDTTDLGLSLVWLWTWSTITSILEDTTAWKVNVTSDQMWTYLCEAVEAGQGFSLEYGAEQHYDDIVDWMLSRDYIGDPTDEDDEDDDQD